MEKIKLGDRVKHIRKSKNLTQSEFAIVLETSAGFISDIESGNKIPGSELLKSLLRKFQVNINWILTGDGDIFISEEENKKLIDSKDIPKENIKEWIDNFWRNATDKEKSWLEIEFERTFPEYYKWIQEKTTEQKKLKTG
jgi:transcriptional regulator with XRE-family HTH domain